MDQTDKDGAHKINHKNPNPVTLTRTLILSFIYYILQADLISIGEGTEDGDAESVKSNYDSEEYEDYQDMTCDQLQNLDHTMFRNNNKITTQDLNDTTYILLPIHKQL